MRQIPVEEAVGQVLCHDLTRIVKGEMKGPQFRKGHVIRESDIPMLLSMGKRTVYVWEMVEGMVHENDAAERLLAICQNANMLPSEVREGKIELKSTCDGLFRVDTDRLNQINSIDEIMIATRHSNTVVHPGDKLAGMRVIPLIVSEQKLLQAEKIGKNVPILEVHPFILKKAGIVTTGSEVSRGIIQDTFTPVLIEKLKEYSIEVISHLTVDDQKGNIISAIREMRTSGADVILCTGGMSVDPDDNTPAAIRDSGAEIITYGTLVLPGAMFLTGYFEDGTPVLGLPGCVMYEKATVFDLAMPRIAAGIRMQKQDFIEMGNGGLCLGCPTCHYPICPFGK